MTLQHPEVVMYIIQGAWAIADKNNTNDKKASDIYQVVYSCTTK